MFDIEALYKSLLRHVHDIMDEAKALGLSSTLDYYAWDSRGDVSETENRDLIGLAGWSFKENGGRWLVHAGVVLSTYNDENLFREIAILNFIHDKLGEQSKIPMRDKETGDKVDELYVAEFEIMPAGQSELRNYRTVALELLRTAI